MDQRLELNRDESVRYLVFIEMVHILLFAIHDINDYYSI